MNCERCRAEFDDSRSKCPKCGAANRQVRGTFQVSTVLVSHGGSERVFRSVEEMPVPLRSQLLKSTNGANSATILIADRRGRREIARAMRALPGSAQRRLIRALNGEETVSRGLPEWLTPLRRKVILAALALLTGGIVALVFTRLG